MLLDLGLHSLFYENHIVSNAELFPVPRPMANVTPKRFKGTIAIVTGGSTQISPPPGALQLYVSRRMP